MSTVDNRVVRMTFDNAQFERNVRTTMNTLSDFEKSLKLNGATAGFNELSKAADKLDMTAIGNKAAKEASKVDQYSSDAAKSIGSIDDAADKTDFSGIGKAAYDAVGTVNDAASSVNMSGINNATQEASDGFSLFGTVATGVLLEIGRDIENLLTGGLAGLGNTIKAYTIDPIMDGFKEYEQQMGSIQTILANTGLDFDSDEDIQLVNDALDELNRYADETIYKFGDMTQAIGTFTAAGLSLDDAVAAVKGVSNVAAFSGASATDVHRVLPQIAQALSAGVVSLQDWRSIETANMASRGFVKTIGDVAKHMADMGLAESSAAEAGQALIDKTVTMRQALNKVDNEDWAGWLTSDILSETLKTFTYDLTSATKEEEQVIRDHLAAIGYLNKEEQDALINQAKMATRSATEVRTWTQLWDTIGESIGSNWAGIWRNILGDFKQATDTFTYLSNTFTNLVDGLLGGFVNAAKVFNESGAIDLIFGGFKRYTQEDFENGLIDEDMIGNKVIDELTNELVRIPGALDNIVAAISVPLNAIGDAFNNVFGPGADASPEEIEAFNQSLAHTLVGLAMSFNDFTSSLIMSDDAATGVRQIFEGLFSVFDVALQIVLDLAAGFFSFVDALRVVIDPLIDIGLALGGQVGKALVWFHDRFLEVRAVLIEAMAPFGNVIESVKDIARAFFDFIDIPGKIQDVGDAVIGFLDGIWEFLDLPSKIRGVGDAFSNIVGAIGDLTGWNAAVEHANQVYEETGERISVVEYWFDQLLQTPVGQFFSIIYEDVKKVFDLFGPLIQALGNFAGKLGEAFLAWEPIKNITDRLDEFKNGSINFFLSLPDRLAQMAGGLPGQLGGIQGAFDGIFKWFNDTTNYFNTVTVEQFLADIKNWANGIIENVMNVFNYFATVTPEQLFNDILKNISTGASNIYTGLREVATNIETIFPEFNGVFTGGLDGIYNVVLNGILNIRNFLRPILEKSETFPEFFANLFIAIGEEIQKGFNGIVEAVKNFKPEDLMNAWYGFSANVKTAIQNTFPSLNPIISDLSFSISTFLNDITKDTDDWGVVFERIVGKIGDSLSGIPDMIFTVFDKIASVVGGIFSWITERLESLPGPIGSFFGMIHDKMEGLGDIVSKGASVIPEKFKILFGGVEKPVDDALGHVDRFWDGFKVGSIPEESTNFLEVIKTFVTDKLGKVGEFISTLPEQFGGIIETIQGIFNAETIEKIIDVVEKLVTTKLLFSLGNMADGIGKLSKTIATHIKKEDTESMGEKFRNVSIAFGVIAGALWTISTINDEDLEKAKNTLILMSGVMIALEAVQGIINRFLPIGDNGNTIKNMAEMLAAIAGSLFVIGKMPQDELSKAEFNIGIVAGILVAMQAIPTVVNALGGSWVPGNFSSCTDMAKALVGMAGALWVISQIDEAELGKAEGTLAVIAGILVAMQSIPSIINRILGSWVPGSGDSIKDMANSMVKIAGALYVVGQMDKEALDRATIALGGLAGMFAGLTAVTNGVDLIATAQSFKAYAFGLIELAGALYIVGQLPVDAINAGAIAIGALVGAFIALADLTLGVDLVATAASVVIFGAGLIEIAAALYIFSEAIRNVPTMEEVYNAGYNIVAGLLTGIIDGIGYVLEHLGEIFGMILEGIKKFFGISSPSTVMADEVGQFLPEGILQGVEDNSEPLMNGIGEFLADLLKKFVDWVKNDALPALGQGAKDFWNWFTTEGLPMLGKAAGDFWHWFTTEGLPMIGNAIAEIGKKLGELGSNFLSWLQSDGLPALSKAAGDFWHWVTTEGLPAIGNFIVEVFKKLGELILNLGKWVLSDGIPAIGKALSDLMGEAGKLGGMLLDWASKLPGKIWEGLGDIFRWAGEIGTNIINGIIDGITSIPSAISDAIVGMASGGLDAIKNFFGIQSPSKVMRDEVGRYVTEGLAVGITKYGGTAVSAADKLGSDVSNSFQSSLGNTNISMGLDTTKAMNGMSQISNTMGQMNFAGTVDQNANINVSSLTNSISLLRTQLSADNNNLISNLEISFGEVKDILYSMNDSSIQSTNDLESLISKVDTNSTLYSEFINRFSDQYAKINSTYNSVLQAQLTTMLDTGKSLRNYISEASDFISEMTDKIRHIEYILENVDGSTREMASFAFREQDHGLNIKGGIYMDTGSLVGAIAPEMDNALGYRQILSNRGV